MFFVTQKGFLGLWGEKVDSIDYYKQQIKDLDEKVSVPTSSGRVARIHFVFM